MNNHNTNENSIILFNDNNNKFVTKLKEHFTKEEQQLYVSNLYMYMNYHPTNDYPINLEDVFKMIGFANKGNSKRTLENNFTEHEDYKITILPSEKGQIAREDIMLNVDTFKNLCMLARTHQGKSIRKYYIKLENVYNEIIKQELDEHKQQIEQSNKQLEQTKRELELYKQKTYEEIEKSGHVYIIQTDGGYKVGKTKDINNRVKGLQTGNNREINVVLDFKTSNSDLLERVVHYILDRYRCNSNREFFDCDPEYITSVITILGSTIDTLKSCYKHISNDELVRRLESGVKFRINNNVVDRPPPYNCIDADFYNWLDKNVIKSHNSLLRLKDVCESYTGRQNVHSKIANRIKTDLELWIKSNFQNIRYIYTDSSFNGMRYKGWIGLELVV